jgi:hypothetical protein
VRLAGRDSELALLSIRITVNTEHHPLPIPVMPMMSRPVAFRDFPEQSECVSILNLRRIQAQMLGKQCDPQRSDGLLIEKSEVQFSVSRQRIVVKVARSHSRPFVIYDH